MALTGVLVVGGASAAAPDNSLTLNGTTQYVRLGQADANPDKLNAATFTLEAWFNRSGTGVTTSTGTGGVTAAPLITKGRAEVDGTNQDANYFLGIDANGRLVADYEEGAGQTSAGLNHPITGTATITNGVWHHTAATFDGTSWRLYLDGRLDATLTVGANRAPRSDSIQDTAIGSALTSTGAAAGFFQGSIDEVRVWNTARTWEQIRDAKDDEVTSGAGLVGRWGLDEGSGTTAADSTANPLSGTLVGSPTWLLGQYGFPQDATPPAAPAGVSAVAGNASVSLAWTANSDGDLAGYNVYRGTSPGVSTAGVPLNGDTLLSAPSYNDATAANGTTYYYAVAAVDTANNKASSEVSATPSATLTALRFDGTNDYVTFGPAAALATPTFTLETWFMRTGAGVGQSTGAGGLASALPLVTKGRNESENSNVDMNYFLGIDTATNRLAVDFEEGATGATPGLNHPLIGNTAIANGVWHHAAATYDGTTWLLYLDGQPDGSLLVGQPARGDSVQHAALGTAMNSTGVAGGFFQGVLDEARIWGVVRTQAEIGETIGQELTSGPGLLGRWGLNEGAGTTAGDSVGGTNGTLTNGPAWVVGVPLAPPPAGPHALQFDGTNDHVTFGQATTKLGVSQFTLEAWFRRTGAGVGTNTGSGGIPSAIPLITKGRAEAEGSNVDMNYFLGIDASTGVLVADFEDTATGENHPVSGVTAIAAGAVWHQAAATYDGTTWRVYLDGKLETRLSVGSFTPRSDSIQHAALGTAMNSTGVAAGFFQGILDEVRVWDLPRSGAQIRSTKDSAISGPQSGLRARWGLDEGGGTSVGDTSGNEVTGTALGGAAWVSPYDFPQDSTAPAAPTGLNATPGDGQAALSWSPNGEPDLAGYNLFRGTSSPVSTSGTPLNGDDLIRATSYQDNGVTNGTTYYYALVAVDASNNASGPSGEANTTPFPAGSKGLQLNGSTQYVTFGAAPGLASPTFTLETWFMRTGPGVGQQTGAGGLASAVPLITKGRNEVDQGSNVDMNYFLGLDTATNRLAVDFEEGSAGSNPSLNHPLIGATAVTSNVWHHVAATYDGTRWKLYLDGKLDASLLVGEPARGDSIQHAALGTAMTSTGVAGGFFQGVLDEARIWNHARTGAEIRAAKNSEGPSGTGLIGHWNLDEASGTSVADSSGNANNGTAVGGALHVSAYGFPQDAIAPAAVQGLSPSAGDGSVTLSWNAGGEGDLAGYNVYRSTSSPVDTGGSPLNGADLLSSPSFTDSGLTNGLTYYYAVVAVDTANNVAVPAETSAVPTASDPVFVGAGDIAGQAWNGDEATAQLLDQIPGTVFTLGDNAYQNGTATEFADYYDPTWGRHRSRTRPTPGNHDYNTPNGTGYFDYFNGSGNFTGPAGDRDKGYYSYDLVGNGVRWHVVVLNSECEASTGLWLPGGCAAGSPQEQWLRNDLENALTNNVIALWHKPRYSSTTLQPHMQALWQVLYDYGVELTLGGHWHNYERLAPMDASGVADPAHGVRQFVVGTGGTTLTGFNTIWPTSEVRNSTTNGVIKLTLHASSYDWQFVPVAGQTFTDSGTAAVHGPPPDTAAPAVTIVSAVPSSLGPADASTEVTWRASENGSYSVRIGGADCTGGIVAAFGTYSASPANVVTTVDADDLADGQNTIRVCVTDAASNTGSATTTVSKNSVPAAHAVSFDGVNDYVTFGQATTSLGASQFTLETWFRRAGAGVGTSTGSGGIAAAVPLIAKGRAQQDGSNLDMNYLLGIDASSGVLVADFEDAASGANHPVAGTTTITADNTWHHAAVSYDGTTWRLYLDGRMDAKLNVGATPRSDSVQHAALGSALDSTGSAAGFFDGALDEVRIWGLARTGAQIRASRDSELAGSPTGLRGRWALNEGLGTSAGDSSGNGVVGTLVNGSTWAVGYGFAPDTTAPAAPTGLDATAGDGQVSLSWNANAEPDVAGYNLYRSTSSPVSTAGTPINGTDLVGGTSYTDTGLSNGTTYHYVALAVDGANNASGASGEASASPVQGDPVFVGAGDIADCTRTQDSATADLLSGIPGTVWTAGDNVYQNGTLAEFGNCYDPTWGAVKARTRPTVGNHDYGNGSNSGEGYFDYFNGSGNFTGPAGDRDKGYYSYDIGAHWHVVSLNSECEIDAACTMAAQEQWLRGDLAANSARNVVGIFHRPRWSSGATRPGDTRQQGLWQTLYEYGAEVVLVGHDHHYERFAPQDGSGQADTNFGVREFVVGTGGAAFTSLGTTAANSQVRNSTTYGVLKLTLHESSYDWQFVPISGQTFTDSGTSPVHAAPNVRPVVDSVTINETAPRTNDTLTATVTSHDPNGDSVTYAYQWRRNGVDIPGATGPTLALSTAAFGDKGDQISLRVTASDAGGAGAPLTSNAVAVQNTPPTATVSLSNHTPTSNQVLTATATRADADADTVLLTYVWKVNGAVRKTTSASSSLTDTFDLSQAGNGDGGDTVTVEVTPNDGTANGTAALDTAVVDSAPAPPTGLTATLSTTAVTLDWNNNSESDLAGYNVYRASSLAGPYVKLNGALLTASLYVDASAPAQATSHYRVTAVDTGGAESSPVATSVERGIAFRASSSGETSGISLALARPNGVVAGDVLVAVVDVRGTPSITAPSGWSLVRVDTNGTALRQAVYLRVAQGSEPASYAWGFGSKQSAAGAVVAYAGVSTSGPLDASSGRTNASSTSITANSLTTSVPNTVLIGLFGTATNGSISPPAAMTEQVEIAVGGKQKAAAEGADALKAGTGSTGTVVATSTAAAVNIGQLVALRPEGAVPPQDTEPPTPPSSLAATPASSSQIDLTWTAAADNVGVDHYEVTRGTTVVGTPAVTHFSDTGLSPSTLYTYTVKAVDAAGNFSAASDAASATTPPSGTAGITLRAAATAGARSAASLSIGKPAGTQSGDVLLASLDVGATPAITAPVGWTLVRRDEAAATLTKATYWHLAGSSEPASFVWTFSAAEPASGVILAYSGADSANPVGAASGAVVSSGTSVTAPSVAVAATGSVLVSFVGFAANTSISPPAGMTERSELIAGAGQARVTGESSDVPQAAGASGPRTATSMKSGAGAGQLVVVRPPP